MRPTEDIFPPNPSLSNYSLPIPIVSVRSPPAQTTPTASSLPNPPTSSSPLLTPRPRDDEGVVLGYLTGEVRRMRSVLDMRLGAMAGAPVLPETEAKLEKKLFQDDAGNVEDRKKIEPEVDVFGLTIGAKDEPLWAVHETLSLSSVSDSGCSVVLAESPSRLDLSALMC